MLCVYNLLIVNSTTTIEVIKFVSIRPLAGWLWHVAEWRHLVIADVLPAQAAGILGAKKCWEQLLLVA